MHLVRKFGPKRWSVIAGHLKGRIGKQCRERCSGQNMMRAGLRPIDASVRCAQLCF